MALRPLRPCSKPGCTALTRQRYCDRHKKEPRPREARPSAYRRGYTRRWAKARVFYLADHPWCAECARQDRREPATEVDHIVPHDGDRERFWDEDNWQGLCASCHSRKTAREDGGFGNRRQ